MSGPDELSRYDLILVLIPGVYAVGLLAQATLPISLIAALVIATLVAATGLLDGLVLNPPL